MAAGTAAALCLLLALPHLRSSFNLEDTTAESAGLVVWLVTAIFGLLLVEQLFRNSSDSERWSIKYLCLGIGGMFAYDFYMYSEALLFGQLDTQLWQARGLISALTAPAAGPL